MSDTTIVRSSGSKRLAIVGCGPRAAAIAVRARVLRDLGWQAPDVVAIEALSPAANWDGSNGYTDGRLLLGTTPLEDVGFPYSSNLGPDVDRLMLAYSYMAYRVACGDYAEWVDRGLVAPTHAMLAAYFKWVVEKSELPVIAATVTRVRADDARWAIEYAGERGAGELVADGIVMTGPGAPMQFPRVGLTPEDESRVLNGQTFWLSASKFNGMSNVRIAVVGGGETSATVTSYLAGVLHASCHIDIVTRHPVVFIRNEHWTEVMYFSTAIGWPSLSDREKIEVIRHADRGTFSVAAKQALDRAYNVGVQIGSLSRIEASAGELQLVLSGHAGERKVPYDYVVEATGFDPMSVLAPFDDPSLFGAAPSLRDRIDHDLSVRGSDPKLHLPGLASMAQGPGFPNLSCLGLMAERILTPYLTAA
jgi:mycobactin lysine-N-oxygenase